MSRIQKEDKNKCWQDGGKNRNLCVPLLGMQNGTGVGEKGLAAPQKVKHQVTIVTQQFHA